VSKLAKIAVSKALSSVWAIKSKHVNSRPMVAWLGVCLKLVRQVKHVAMVSVCQLVAIYAAMEMCAAMTRVSASASKTAMAAGNGEKVHLAPADKTVFRANAKPRLEERLAIPALITQIVSAAFASLPPKANAVPNSA
jgi:hypothetical protein